MVKSRRKAREAALRALYEMEIGKARLGDAISGMRAHADIPEEQVDFAQELVEGVHQHMDMIDDRLAVMVRDWDFDRLAAIDRNLMRIAAFELYYCDAVPPAVSINEAIEIAKKYSTAESGRFINGVLGRLVQDTPKANWDAEHFKGQIEERAAPEPEPEEKTITPDDPEAQELSKVGLWKIRADEDAR